VQRGFLIGLSNPKSLTFFAAFFPQFIDAAAPAGPQFASLAISYAVLALFLDAGYALAGGMGNRFLATNRARFWLGRASGLVLIGGGALLAGVRKD
jgi:threonine/homoserine/homoserine lactone efflux protein